MLRRACSTGCVSVLVAVVALVPAWVFLPSTKWRLRSFSNVIYRWRGVDIRAIQTFSYNFPDYGYYDEARGSWPQMERRHIDELTGQELLERYVRARRPVIVTGLYHPRWSPQRLAAECSDMQVMFDHGYISGLAATPKTFQKLFLDPRLAAVYGNSTDGPLDSEEVHRVRTTPVAAAEYVGWLDAERQLIDEARARTPDLYIAIADFLWPPMVNADQVDRQKCPALLEDADNFMLNLTSLGGQPRTDIDPVLFLHPAGSRPFPLHQHGPINDNLVWLLNGRKRAVVAPPADDKWLYERPELGGTDMSDRVFGAELMKPDFKAQPDVRNVRAMEGTIGAGELLYLPANSVHVVDNVGQGNDHSLMLAWQLGVPALARILGGQGPGECDHLEEVAAFPHAHSLCEPRVPSTE